MPYITRGDGERFVIPSYRDTLIAPKASLLKKEVMALSASYGEYVAIQKKTATEYEVALSHDTGYLLGECVWHHFKRPYDMIYCEEIPNTAEAILVIVKSGSVYLDGSFPLDSIPEELVIFKTQQNNFSIYIHGDVPISQTFEDGKFNFDEGSVKLFEVLPEPLFPTLPVVKAFRLQLVDVALKEFGIGVLPIKPIIYSGLILAVIFVLYNYTSKIKEAIPVSLPVVSIAANPYQAYFDQLTSPDPAKQIRNIIDAIYRLYTVPGWKPTVTDYTTGTPGRLTTKMMSDGARTEILLAWVNRNNAIIEIKPDGIFVTQIIFAPMRDRPDKIYSIQSLLSTLIDRVSYIVHGDVVQLTPLTDRRTFAETNVSLNLANVTPITVNIISRTIENLPLVLTKFNFTISEGTMSGIITLKALGN